MQLLISDANILIDMDVANILDRMFALDYEFAVPDILYAQELHAHHPHLLDLGLLQLELTEDSIYEIVEIKSRGASLGISTNDLFSLVLAKQEQTLLLTCDKALRRLAEREGIQVHGTIWLIEKLFDADLLSTEEATSAYQAMREDGSWLPWDEVHNQLERFSGTE